MFPLDGNITSLYAMRLDPFYDPVSGEEPTYEFHHGIDISASKSRDILPCADGEVVFNGYDSSYGYYLMIDHGSFVSLYAHCGVLLLRGRRQGFCRRAHRYGRQHRALDRPTPSF